MLKEMGVIECIPMSSPIDPNKKLMPRGEAGVSEVSH